MQEKHEKQAESRRFSLILKAETINYLFEDHRDMDKIQYNSKQQVWLFLGGKDANDYQFINGYLDFVCYSPQVVLDTKYIPRFEHGNIDTYIVRQLSVYSRDKWIFPTKPDANVPCVIIYPVEGAMNNPFKGKRLEDFLNTEDHNLWNFHRIAVPIPLYSAISSYGL